MTTETFVKDIKPGLKNLNLIFIVLETGGYAGWWVPCAGSQGWGAKVENTTSVLNLLSILNLITPRQWSHPVTLPDPGLESCSEV